MEDPGDAPAEVPMEDELRKPRRWFRVWPGVMTVCAVIVTVIIGYPWAHERGVEEERARVGASASAAAADQDIPDDLYCPDFDSDDAKDAVRVQPVVTVTKSSPQKLLVMRKAVVVVIEANVVVTGDIVVCGNDAVLALKGTLRESARILMQGGTDSKTKGEGPAIYLVDGAQPPQMNRVWFSNKNPRIIPCYADPDKSVAAEAQRPCTSYYSTRPPSPAPSR